MTRVTNWNLVTSTYPDEYSCDSCGAVNMLSRKTILLSWTPSVFLMLALALARPLWLSDLPLLLAVSAAYVLGLPFGLFLARRFGRLVPPYKPLL
jgi:hypothetical protein